MATFIGRALELKTLEDCFRVSRQGRLQVVAIDGDSGIGKSRLIQELRNRLCASAGVRFCVGHCLEYVRAPYLPFGEVFSELGLSLPQQRPSAGIETDPDAKFRYFGAVADEVLKQSTKRMLVVAIEDVHWADDATTQLVQYLALRLRDSRLLMLLTHRSDSPQTASATGALLTRLVRLNATHLRVRPLGHEDGWALAKSLSREYSVPLEVFRRLESVADGNPLFIEELVRMACDRANDEFKGRLQIPLTIRAMLSERMLSLSEQDSHVLMQAAVIGRNFDLEFLCDICGCARARVLATLQRARGLQLIVEDPERTPRYSFRHALVRETLYQELLTDVVRPLHARVAARMEANPQTANALAELAYHWTAAGDEAKAVDYNERAGDAAAAVCAYSDAARFYREALRFTYAAEQRARLRERLALALRGNEGGDECQVWLERAYQDYQQLGDVASMVRILLHLGMQQWLDCNTEGSVSCASRAIDLLSGSPDCTLLLKARLYKAAFCSTLGRVEEARTLLAAVEAMELSRDDEANALMYEVIAETEAALDFGDKAFSSLKLAASFAKRSRNNDMTSYVENMFVITSSLVGGMNESHTHFERAVSAARENALFWRESHACVHYADVLMLGGELERARDVLNVGLAIPVPSPTIRGCATFAGIPLASMLEDEALAERLADDKLIEDTLGCQEPQRIAAMAAAFAEFYAGRGEIARAQTLLRRALRASKRFHFSWRLAAQVALLGDATDVEDLRRLSATAPAIREPMSAAFNGLVWATVATRFESAQQGGVLALRAAERFAAIGCRLYEARALEIARRLRDALSLYEAMGSRRDVRRLRGTLHIGVPREVAGIKHPLTARQQEVAALLAHGESYREIAGLLSISQNTVEHHVTEIFSRLGVASRGQLAARLLGSQDSSPINLAG